MYITSNLAKDTMLRVVQGGFDKTQEFTVVSLPPKLEMGARREKNIYTKPCILKIQMLETSLEVT